MLGAEVLPELFEITLKKERIRIAEEEQFARRDACALVDCTPKSDVLREMDNLNGKFLSEMIEDVDFFVVVIDDDDFNLIEIGEKSAQ